MLNISYYGFDHLRTRLFIKNQGNKSKTVLDKNNFLPSKWVCYGKGNLQHLCLSMERRSGFLETIQREAVRRPSIFERSIHVIGYTTLLILILHLYRRRAAIHPASMLSQQLINTGISSHSMLQKCLSNPSQKLKRSNLTVFHPFNIPLTNSTIADCQRVENPKSFRCYS